MTSIQYHYIIGKQCVTNLHYNSTTGISVRENLCLTLIKGNSDQYENLSHELHRILIDSLCCSDTLSTLLIIPTDKLYYLPFESVLDNENRFLIQNKSIAYLPSLFCLSIVPQVDEKFENPKIVGIGNPDLGMPDFDLPYSEEEILSIKQNFPETRILLRNLASEKNLKQIDSADILHIACHGDFDAYLPDFSYLMLCGDESDDGNLYLNEIWELKLSVKLTVIASCQTGKVDINAGDDITGISQSFFIAGSQSIIASFWSIDDKATSILMKNFYQSLRSDMTIKDALRSAKLKFIKSPVPIEYHHPFYWSAFSLLGNF